MGIGTHEDLRARSETSRWEAAQVWAGLLGVPLSVAAMLFVVHKTISSPDIESALQMVRINRLVGDNDLEYQLELLAPLIGGVVGIILIAILGNMIFNNGINVARRASARDRVNWWD